MASRGPDAGSGGAGQALEGEVILPNRAVAPSQQGGSVPSVVGALEPMIPEMRAAQADIRRVLGDEEYFAPRQPIDVDALEPNRRAIARASVALEEFVAQNRALRAEQAARALPDGGASGAGNAADRFRTNDTPVPVNEGWDTAGSLQQGVDDLAAQRGGWDTMGGRDMGEALIRRHGLDGALEQINRIMADPASRRARQRNGDQGAWEAVQRYIQASVNRRGIGLAPDAPNAGQRGGNGAALAALATLPPGAITLRELLRDHYGTA